MKWFFLDPNDFQIAMETFERKDVLCELMSFFETLFCQR